MLEIRNVHITQNKDLKVLVEDLSFTLNPGEKAAIIGEEGNGKSTLLRSIYDTLSRRADLNVFYMPQDPADMLDMRKTPVEILSAAGGKEETVRNGVALGSMKFTAEEMNHPCAMLSGGQKAKLMFLAMANSHTNVLLLDEPTRNLSPISGPVVRALFEGYPGCIIAISHDQRFESEVCTRSLRLTPDGFL